jgi:hypothetical protein
MSRYSLALAALLLSVTGSWASVHGHLTPKERHELHLVLAKLVKSGDLYLSQATEYAKPSEEVVAYDMFVGRQCKN